jgi:hypothetical protein
MSSALKSDNLTATTSQAYTACYREHFYKISEKPEDGSKV